jgi:hypothetical protein
MTPEAVWEAAMQAEEPPERSVGPRYGLRVAEDRTGPHGVQWVSRAALAEIMNVSISTVDRLRGEGMPSTTWGRRTRRFDPAAAMGWAYEAGAPR